MKIVMTEEDMASFKLGGKTEISSSDYRRNFWRVLDLAKNEVGFDPEGDKILIQFYPLKNGGCEIFVTKLGILSKESAKMVTRSDNVTMLSRSRSVYSFETREDLLRFVSCIKSSVKLSESCVDVYKTQSARYYLLVEEFSKNDATDLPMICEYARPMHSDFEYFVSEHLERLTNGNGIEQIENLI